jgi:hypothetical protein
VGHVWLVAQCGSSSIFKPWNSLDSTEFHHACNRFTAFEEPKAVDGLNIVQEASREKITLDSAPSKQ